MLSLVLGFTITVSLGFVLLTHWIYKWRNPKCNGVLLPGSMGLPIIGETLQFFKTSKSIDLSPFIKTRINRYGGVFKTSLVGRPVVVSCDPTFNHYILQEEGKLVELWYMDSFAKIFGTGSIGDIHNFTRNLIQSKVGVNKIKQDLLTKMESSSRKALDAWAEKEGSIELKGAFAEMVFDLTASSLFGYNPEKSKGKNLSSKLGSIMQGLMSVPLNLPGTAFHKCMQTQKVLSQVMKELVEERLSSPESRRDDLLDLFLDGMKRESFVTVDFIVYAMFGVLFASFETVSTVICLAVIYLSDQPEAVKQIQKEQEEIILKRQDGDTTVSWAEYKSMTFTMHVVNEALRMANVLPGFLRRATQDIHYNGYTIPKGWTIMVVTSTLHFHSETYDDPLSFNPARWKDLSPGVAAKNFMPFGWGVRSCVGADFAKAMMAVFLHVLVTDYRWEKVKAGEIRRAPVLHFGQDGVHINIIKK